MVVSIAHHVRVSATAIHGTVERMTLPAAWRRKAKGSITTSWTSAQTAKAPTRATAHTASSISTAKRKRPPQKETTDLPRSHHVTNSAVTNSWRLFRIGIETTDSAVAQQATSTAHA